ncbi:hypothetical protein K432DRAFT_387581, partial [Lepidopterella palustris CBS 459.81]
MAPSVRWKALLSGIGLGQQTAGHSPPRLSLARSESEHLAATGPVDTTREFDTDSVIFEASSLAVHRLGFRFSLRPLFIHAIKQDQKVTIHGHELHKTKHICIGQGRLSGGFGYSCHVFFPNMSMVRRNEGSAATTELTTFLNNDTYGIWIERIVLPTLREVCGPGYLQHYPKTYDEILGKANVKQEILDPENGSGVINHQIILPEHVLEPFWAGVQRRSQSIQDTESSDYPFKGLFLVVSAHNLKLDEKTTSPCRLKNRFLSHLQTIFRLEPQYISKNSFFVDFGIEDLPAREGTTLLRKEHCLKKWASKFHCPGPQTSAFTKELFFSWAITRDVGSASVELFPSNALCRHGGLFYNKAYNIIKEQFATAVKGLAPFQNPHLEGLAYTEETLHRWYQTAGTVARTGQAKRQQILTELRATKRRLYSALTAPSTVRYGVRQEYRMTLPTFLAFMDYLEADPTADEGGPQSHRPYWVVATEHVDKFRLSELNRWLLCLESLASEAEPEPGTGAVIPAERQQLHAAMAAAMRRLLHLSASCGCPNWVPSLWKGKRKTSARRRKKGEGGPGRPPTAQPKYKRQGLGLEAAVQTYGMAWFPEHIVHWDAGLPVFTERDMKTLDVAFNGLQRSFRTANLQRAIAREDATWTFLRTQILELHGRDEMPGAYITCAQLCVQEYVKWVFSKLGERWRKHILADGRQVPAEGLTRSLSPRVANGLEGLAWHNIVRLLEGEVEDEDIRRVRAKENVGARNGAVRFPGHASGRWADRVKPIFIWEKEGEPQRTWKGAHPFRIMVVKIESILREEIGPDAIGGFHEELGATACDHLWTILHYDFSKASVMYKANNRSHGAETIAYIKSLSELARTNFVVPTVEPKCRRRVEIIADHLHRCRVLGLAATEAETARFMVARRRVIPSRYTERFGILMEADTPRKEALKWVPTCKDSFGMPVVMRKAERFWEEFEEWKRLGGNGRTGGDEDEDESGWDSEGE